MKQPSDLCSVAPSTQGPPLEGPSLSPPPAVAGGRALSRGYDRRPAPHHISSRYPGAAPSPDESHIERARWAAVDDLQAAYRRWVSTGSPSQGNDDILLQAPERPDNVLLDHLRTEVGRVLPSRGRPPSKHLAGDRATLLQAAYRPVAWARMHTQEVNPAVLARFAVEVAYDDLFRMNVAATLAEPWPTRWKWSVPDGGGPYRLTLTPDSAGLPINPKDFNRLDVATAEYAGTKIPRHNSVPPFLGLRPAWPWAMDPIRPPVQSIRTAAAVILRTLGFNSLGLPDSFHWTMDRTNPPVLAIEVGHSAGAEALALFLKGHTIYTHSTVFSSPTHHDVPDRFKAIILNLPHVAALKFVTDLLNRHEQDRPVMNRVENNRYWTWPDSDPGERWKHLVHCALDRLAPEGVLVVLGDVLSGHIHLAAKEIEHHGEMTRTDLWPGGPPAISFDYERKPWALYGCIRPTGRILGAWRRRA